MKEVATFGSRLQEALDDANLRPVDLAKLSGIDKGLLSYYIHGKVKPGIDILKKIAETLRVNPVWLLGYDAEKSDELIKKRKQILDLVDSMDKKEVADVIDYCNYIIGKRRH